MYELYQFVTGPLAWISFGIFIIGMTVRVVRLINLASKKDKVVFNHLHLGWSLRSIFYWLIPFGSRGMREKPVFTVATFAFHICLLVTPIFLLSHNIIWDEKWSITWWSLPETMADYMTLILILAAIFLLLRRIVLPEVRIVTTACDYILLAIATAPFVTGYFAYHQCRHLRPFC